MYFTYIIYSKSSKKYYIGSTSDINRRLTEHNSNQTKSLRNKGPFEIVHFEEFETLSQARRRELLIKSYKGGNAFKKLIYK